MGEGKRLMASKRKAVYGADPQCTLRPVDGALSLPGVSQHNATKEEREGGRRAYRKRPLERFAGRKAVMLHQPNGECTHSQRRRIVATVIDGSAGMSDCCSSVVLFEPTSHEQDQVAPGEQAVGARIVGLQR